MARKRLSRKELTQKDEITSTLERVTSYSVEHSQQLLGLLGIVAVIAVAVIGWNLYASNRDAASQNELSEVIRAYNDTTAYASDEERLLAVVADAERVRATYPGSPAAEVASYYVALCYDGLGDFEQAESELNELIEGGSEGVRQVARYALGEAYKKRGELERAIEVFQELADAGGYGQGVVLVELGRLNESLSRPDEARGYYESVVSEFPDSPFRVDADRALKRLAEATERASEESES